MLDPERISLELPGKMLTLILIPFDTDIDIESLLEVQHHNIYGELATISRLMNRVGNLKAEMNQVLAETKLDFDIFYAQMHEEKKKELTFTTGTTTKYPTVDQLEAAIVRSPEYKVKKQYVFKIQKNLEYVDSLYESVKNKSFAIMKITDKLHPDEFEKNLVEGVVNGMMIKLSKKSIN